MFWQMEDMWADYEGIRLTDTDPVPEESSALHLRIAQLEQEVPMQRCNAHGWIYLHFRLQH